MLTTEQFAAVSEAEDRIQKILIDLVNEHGIEIEDVQVDTRRFANLRVGITSLAGTQPGHLLSPS